MQHADGTGSFLLSTTGQTLLHLQKRYQAVSRSKFTSEASDAAHVCIDSLCLLIITYTHGQRDTRRRDSESASCMTTGKDHREELMSNHSGSYTADLALCTRCCPNLGY